MVDGPALLEEARKPRPHGHQKAHQITTKDDSNAIYQGTAKC